MSTDPFAPLKKALTEGRVRTREFPGLGTVVTIDHLGPATKEQRAEVKAARRSFWAGVLHRTGVAAAFVLVALVFAVAGAFYGASDPDGVKDLMPSVPSPSGERAEPEEEAR